MERGGRGAVGRRKERGKRWVRSRERKVRE